jgi:hypothetical protein
MQSIYFSVRVRNCVITVHNFKFTITFRIYNDREPTGFLSGKFHGSHTKVAGKFFRILAVGNGYGGLGKLSIVFVMNVSSPSCGKWKLCDIFCRGNIVIK